MGGGTLVVVLGLLAAPSARAQQDVAHSQLAALEAAVPQRRLSPPERELILGLLRSAELDSGPFKDRVSLVKYFLQHGVALSAQPGTALAQTDLARLARAARAASEAFHIPPPILLCLTFRESSFNARASAWTTSAKGVGQLTNGAVTEVVEKVSRDARLRNEMQTYATMLGAQMPTGVEGAGDVDVITRELRRLESSGADKAAIEQKRRERQAAIASHKDEPGHIYNLETNFGLSAAYLSYLRHRRLAEVVEPQKGWLTAVGAYNQGLGVMNELIYSVFRGARDHNAQPFDALLSPENARKLTIAPERSEELIGEIGSVYRCSKR